jgi:hypothetical protein
MMTVRTYWSLAEAALAKSVLDNYEIPCALLDENAGRYNFGQQIAVPIRLVVDENKVDRAICILNEDFEKAAAIESAEECEEVEHPASLESVNQNAWELLVLAFSLALPAICIISKVSPANIGGRWARYWVACVTVSRFLSWLAVLLAGILVALYLRIRRSARESNSDTTLGIS